MNIIPEIETAPPKSTALSSDTMVNVWPNLGGGISPETWTFCESIFFIYYYTLSFEIN